MTQGAREWGAHDSVTWGACDSSGSLCLGGLVTQGLLVAFVTKLIDPVPKRALTHTIVRDLSSGPLQRGLPVVYS